MKVINRRLADIVPYAANAKKHDRVCYMMELDPRYCDVIVKRWENLTGEKAVLLHDD